MKILKFIKKHKGLTAYIIILIIAVSFYIFYTTRARYILKDRFNIVLPESYDEFIDEYNIIPNFHNTNEWFNVDENNITEIYHSYRKDIKLRCKCMREIYVFICKEDDNIYLYVSF